MAVVKRNRGQALALRWERISRALSKKMQLHAIDWLSVAADGAEASLRPRLAEGGCGSLEGQASAVGAGREQTNAKGWLGGNVSVKKGNVCLRRLVSCV